MSIVALWATAIIVAVVFFVGGFVAGATFEQWRYGRLDEINRNLRDVALKKSTSSLSAKKGDVS